MELEQTRKAIDSYIELFKGIRTLAHSDDLAIAILHEIAKDIRAEDIKARFDRQQQILEKSVNQKGERLATPKQINLLRQRQVEIPEGLSLSQASRMIDELKNKND